MDKNEKLLLLQLILEDIRGNWAFQVEERVDEALKIAEDLELEQFINSIEEFWQDFVDGCEDGRCFRKHYDDGGYIGMKEVHGLEPTALDKSDEFKSKICILTFKEDLVPDWYEFERL